MSRHLVVVHNNIDTRSSIGMIAMHEVKAALERGWRVTVVCRDLAPQLVGQVEWRELYVPPRVHLLQWSVARPTVQFALHGLRPDVLVVHQPQLAAMADIWHVHFLSRAARRAVPSRAQGARDRVREMQLDAVAFMEDWYLRRIPPSTRMLFCSEMLQTDFEEIYGGTRNGTVLYNPALLPGSSPGADADPNFGLRRELVGDWSGPVVGFLGGADPRKGGDEVVEAVAREPDLFLLHAGAGDLDVSDDRLQGRTRGMGYLSDVRCLLDAVDVLLVPSRYDPFPLVVLEAAARGVPVMVSPKVGAAALVVKTGAGTMWPTGAPIGPSIRKIMARREEYSNGARELVARLDPRRWQEQLFAEIELVVEEKKATLRRF